MNFHDVELLPYSGSIDGLLEKCASLDADAIEEQVEHDVKCKQIFEIMEMFDCSQEEAEVLHEETIKNIIKEQLDVLVAEGKVKIVGTDDDGQPLYAAVEPEQKASEKKKRSPRKKS